MIPDSERKLGKFELVDTVGIGAFGTCQGDRANRFPDVPKRAVDSLLKGLKGTRLWIWVGVTVVLGAYLTWIGFTNG